MNVCAPGEAVQYAPGEAVEYAPGQAAQDAPGEAVQYDRFCTTAPWSRGADAEDTQPETGLWRLQGS